MARFSTTHLLAIVHTGSYNIWAENYKTQFPIHIQQCLVMSETGAHCRYGILCFFNLFLPFDAEFLNSQEKRFLSASDSWRLRFRCFISDRSPQLIKLIWAIANYQVTFWRSSLSSASNNRAIVSGASNQQSTNHNPHFAEWNYSNSCCCW